MKYLIVVLAALFVLGGCSSSAKKEDASYKNTVKAGYNAQTGDILDEEFDTLIAPEYDYETEVPYEVQIKNSSSVNTNTKTAKQAKSAKKPVAIKK